MIVWAHAFGVLFLLALGPAAGEQNEIIPSARSPLEIEDVRIHVDPNATTGAAVPVAIPNTVFTSRVGRSLDSEAQARRLFGVAIVEIAGVAFQLEIAGAGFTVNDRLRIIDATKTCGSAGASTNTHVLSGPLADDPNTPGIAGTTGNIFTSIRWINLVLGFSGVYRGCYCQNLGPDCDTDAEFGIDIGSILTVSGAGENQEHDCVKFAPCVLTIAGILSDFDRLRMIGTSDPVGGCGVAGTTSLAIQFPDVNFIFLYPDSGGSASQKTFSIGRGTNIGLFEVCYCPNYQNCMLDTSFTHTSGVLTVRGPTGAEFQLCTAGVSCTLGPFTGLELSSDDSMSLVATTAGTEECGTTTRDLTTNIAQGVYLAMTFSTTTTSRQLAAVDLPKGGVWKICYCANYDNSDSVVCNNETEFTAEAGTLTVHGAAGVETFACAIDGACVVTVSGTSLSSDDNVQVVTVGDLVE
jgi:hypothetical protein